MVVGNYNYHQIMFTVDILKHDYEKLSYFVKIRNELDRIIDCFEENKVLPLKMYASKNITIEGSCAEFNSFIIKQFETLSTNSNDKRFPGESQLRGLVRAELRNYQRLCSIISDDISKFKKNIEKQCNMPKVTVEHKQNYITLQKVTPSHISELLENEGGKIIWDSSIGKLVDILKIIGVLEINSSITEDNIINTICDRFVTSDKENYVPNYVQKIYKMMEKTIWLNSRSRAPKYFY